MNTQQKLSDAERIELISAYIERYGQSLSLTDENILTHSDKNFWAYEKFADLAKCEPVAAFSVILGTLAATDREDVLDNLAAGPLEDLIRIHGEQFIEQIEAQAHRDQRFRNLLSGVWNVGTPDVWARIVKLQQEDGTV